MKVLLVNGSPHRQGCTAAALAVVGDTLREEGIQSEVFWIGTKPIQGCIACKRCGEKGACVFEDRVNEFLDLAAGYDGFVFGSPVHYAAMTGSMTSFLDRAFFTDLCAKRNTFLLKPAAALVSARRAGTTAALDQMNKYFLHAQMPIVSSRYWNMVHGNTPKEVAQDQEGLQILRVLARNLAWFLRCKEAGEKLGVPLPRQEERIATNYIRES